MPFGGQAIARNGASGANVVHANVEFDSPLKNADYRAVAILVSGGLNDYDANYDVNVSISKKDCFRLHDRYTSGYRGNA